jgi:hypothetical protein
MKIASLCLLLCACVGTEPASTPADGTPGHADESKAKLVEFTKAHLLAADGAFQPRGLTELPTALQQEMVGLLAAGPALGGEYVGVRAHQSVRSEASCFALMGMHRRGDNDTFQRIDVYIYAGDHTLISSGPVVVLDQGVPRWILSDAKSGESARDIVWPPKVVERLLFVDRPLGREPLEEIAVDNAPDVVNALVKGEFKGRFKLYAGKGDRGVRFYVVAVMDREPHYPQGSEGEVYVIHAGIRLEHAHVTVTVDGRGGAEWTVRFTPWQLWRAPTKPSPK